MRQLRNMSVHTLWLDGFTSAAGGGGLGCRETTLNVPRLLGSYFVLISRFRVEDVGLRVRVQGWELGVKV